MDPLLQRYAESALKASLRAVDKRQGWRGPILHLDEAQLAAALPAWREPAAGGGAAGRPHGLGSLAGPRRRRRARGGGRGRRGAHGAPAAAGGRRGLRRASSSRCARRRRCSTSGNAKGILPLSDVAWARKFGPTAASPAPRQLSAVVARGDIVLVRVMQGRTPPLRLARAGKPVPLSLEQTPLVQGAFVVIDPATRGVRALVGGYDFATSQFNRAIQARRQPGSAFKPFVWGAAIESRRFTPATIVYDTPDLYRDPWTGKEWKPKNFERDAFDGPMLLQQALAHSKNTVSVKLARRARRGPRRRLREADGDRGRAPAQPHARARHRRGDAAGAGERATPRSPPRGAASPPCSSCASATGRARCSTKPLPEPRRRRRRPRARAARRAPAALGAPPRPPRRARGTPSPARRRRAAAAGGALDRPRATGPGRTSPSSSSR